MLWQPTKSRPGYPQTKVIGFILLAGGLILFSYGLFLLLQPNQYRATARIKIYPDVDDVGWINPPPVAYDPYFLQATLEIMQSEVVLSNVVVTLKLDEVWGRKYASGKKLSFDEIRRRIKARLEMRPARNARLIDVSFVSDDPKEAARIANAIVKAYGDWRKERRYQLAEADLRASQKQYDDEEKRIQIQQEKVDADKEHPRDYNEAKARLVQLKNLHEILFAKITAQKIDASHIRKSVVQVIDPAAPPDSPVSPNRHRGWMLLTFGVILTGVGIFSVGMRSSGQN